jgi:2-dehydropantoate 2-reductase
VTAASGRPRLAIVGAGAIGGLAGAYMTRAGYPVVMVDRWREHVDAMKAGGLSIDGVRGPLHVAVEACHPDELEGGFDGVLIATKSQHTQEAVRSILPVLRPETFVVSFQNGFNEPDIVRLLTEAGFPGSRQVIGSIPNYGGALLDPGQIEFVHEGAIQLGEMDGARTERLGTLAASLAALTEVQVSDHIWGQIWAKEVYSVQVVFSALVDAPLADTLGVERWARVAGAIVREALEVADANGVTVEAFDFFQPDNYRPRTAADTRRLLDNIAHAVWLLRKDQKAGYRFRKQGSGIWWDIVYRKRPSEVRSSVGKLVEFGNRAGTDTRLIGKMCDMIYDIEEGRRELGLANYAELESFVAACGKTLP